MKARILLIGLHGLLRLLGGNIEACQMVLRTYSRQHIYTVKYAVAETITLNVDLRPV
jgi:hypothetical protein